MSAHVTHPPPDLLEVEPTRDRIVDRHSGMSVVRWTAASLVGACVAFALGAAVLVSTGVDLDGAVQAGTVTEALPAMSDAAPALTVTFVAWMVGATLFALAGAGLGRLHGDRPAGVAAAGLMTLGAALAVPAFLAMLALVHVVAAATDPSTALVGTVGWLASTTDWVATILIIGLPPLLVARAGRDTWAPGWLVGLATAAAVTSGLTAVSLLTGSGLTTWGFALVPVGMAAQISTGVLLWQRG